MDADEKPILSLDSEVFGAVMCSLTVLFRSWIAIGLHPDLLAGAAPDLLRPMLMTGALISL